MKEKLKTWVCDLKHGLMKALLSKGIQYSQNMGKPASGFLRQGPDSDSLTVEEIEKLTSTTILFEAVSISFETTKLGRMSWMMAIVCPV